MTAPDRLILVRAWLSILAVSVAAFVVTLVAHPMIIVGSRVVTGTSLAWLLSIIAFLAGVVGVVWRAVRRRAWGLVYVSAPAAWCGVALVAVGLTSYSTQSALEYVVAGAFAALVAVGLG